MKLQVFAVRDRATIQFANPLFLLSSGQAIRVFTDEVNRPPQEAGGNSIYAHPEDYDLYSLGTYDTDTAMFETKVPEQICIGKAVAIRS